MNRDDAGGPGQRPLRCFVAVELPQEIRDKIAPLQERIAMGGVRLVKPDLIHITLKFLGDVPNNRVDEVVSALRSVTFQPFKADIEGVGAFPGRTVRVVWLGARGEFETLARSVDLALAPMGFPREDGFRAHATLARVKDPKAGIMLRERISSLEGATLGSFTVDRFLLKKSTLTPGGPIYENLAEFRSA